MTPRSAQILSLSDAGHHPAAIARALSISVGSVYAVLRLHRPNRPRKPRLRTSDLPYKIHTLAARGITPPRIAVLMKCSRAYVYRVLRGREMGPPPY